MISAAMSAIAFALEADPTMWQHDYVKKKMDLLDFE